MCPKSIIRDYASISSKVKSENGVPANRRKKRKVNYDDDPFVCQKCHQEFSSEVMTLIGLVPWSAFNELGYIE